MLKHSTVMRDWLPMIAAVCAVVAAAIYAHTRQAHAAEEMHEAQDLAASLSAAADLAASGTLSTQDIETLNTLQQDLEHRMADTLEPSLVQAELMKSAGIVGLVLRGISPLQRAYRAPDQNPAAAYPRYRVLVSGTYQQVAEYMQLCSRQRLPARVTEFHIRRAAGEDEMSATELNADITVEAFQPHSSDEGQRDSN